MSTVSAGSSAGSTAADPVSRNLGPRCVTEHSVEIVSDSGEGAQKAGQIFGSVSAKMGNGVWTVEIIPAEIQPPARSPAGASGVRIRLGTERVTNWGDHANLVVAFNEQVLLARHRLNALADDAIILIDDRWTREDDERIRAEWDAAMVELGTRGYLVIPVPIHDTAAEVVENPQRGKNMFALGLLTTIYGRDVQRVKEQISHQFRKKSQKVRDLNFALLDRGMQWAEENLPLRVEIETNAPEQALVVMNGNQAIGMGAIAAGLEMCAMYPITPATSVSHYLSDIFDQVGGILHQAEDEIAAAGVAIGASYAGRVAFTVTSGPGLALKTEFLGLAVMTEIPLVVVDVQRGGPSTGLPTKVEQSDLLAAVFGQPGDAPKVVMAPSTIEECFHCMVTARRIAETFRCVVIVLTDANLATGVQPFPRPTLDPRWVAQKPDMGPVPSGTRPYDWDPDRGLSERIIPGRKGGMHTVTGLIHDENSKVSYARGVNQRASDMRSRKLAVLQDTLRPPEVFGADAGDLLIVGWGSTQGTIEEAVQIARTEGYSVASVHLRFLSPLEPGLKEIFSRFRHVMTVEINYSDDPDSPYINDENRRRGQLCYMLRATTLVDIDCWTRVPGEPLRPGQVLDTIRSRLGEEVNR